MNRKTLAEIAKKYATQTLHGNVMGLSSNLEPVVLNFPGWTLDQWDNKWCAAFVYFCVQETGFSLEAKNEDYHFAGCESWDRWGQNSDRAQYIRDINVGQVGDIILFDHVFQNDFHDHIGIVIECYEDHYIVAEGNIGNVSGIVKRKKDAHIRCFIRIVD